MTGKILIVDDEPDVLEVLNTNLTREGYTVRTASNSQQALERIARDKPDLLLLDIILPDISGVQLAARLKNSPETAEMPIILLTAKDSETDMIVGLSVGADDYVTKPFSTAVLVARIDAVLRRSALPKADRDRAVLAGPVRIDPDSHQVFVEGRQVELTLAEFNLLFALVKGNGVILSRQQLLAELGDEETHSNERVVDVHIAALRKKLNCDKDPVKTVHRRGYRFQS